VKNGQKKPGRRGSECVTRAEEAVKDAQMSLKRAKGNA
jgi:hypothetical protein